MPEDNTSNQVPDNPPSDVSPADVGGGRKDIQAGEAIPTSPPPDPPEPSNSQEDS